MSAGGPSAANGLRLDVPSKGKSPTTIQVKAGDIWRFCASGRWLDWYVPCGPDGYRTFFLHILDIRPPLNDAPWFCLVGRYKNRPGSEFRIGSGAVHCFDDDGEIEFFANDLDSMQWNNAGQISLTAEKLSAWPADQSTLSGTWSLVVEHKRESPTKVGWNAYLTALVASLGPLWKLVREVFDRTTGLVFITAMIVGVGAALAFLPQGQDLVRSMSEDDPILPDSWLPGPQQVAFGISLFFLCMQAWFWPRVLINFNYGSNRRHWRPRGFLTWFPRILGLAPVYFAVMALNSSPQVSVGFVISTAIAPLLFFLWVILRHDHGIGRKTAAEDAEDAEGDCEHECVSAGDGAAPRLPDRVGRFWVLFCLGVAILSVVLLCVAPVPVTQALGAPAVVFFGFALLIPPATILIQTGAPVKFPVLSVAIAWAIFLSAFIVDHHVGARAGGTAPSGEVRQVDLAKAYKTWKDQAPRYPDGTIPVVLVASEGGASRAGFWTGEVLSVLEARTDSQFSRSVFAISSVSGGSVGAVGFAAALQDHRGKADLLKAQVTALTGADALSPVVGGLLYTDLISRFAPFGFPDRAEALERAWEDAWARHCKGAGCPTDRLRGPFLDIWRDGDPNWTPLVIVNGASEESGRRIVTSKLALRVDQVNVDDFYATTHSNVAASTAIHNGARFPYISPAGALVSPDGKTHGHIVDGGYFDPAGTEVVRELAHAIKRVAGEEEARQLRFIFVYIGYGQSLMRQTAGNPQVRVSGSTASTAKTANEALAPIRSLLSSRDAHARHMARNLKADVSLDGQELSWNEYAAGPNVGAALAGTYVPILLCDNPENLREKREFTMPMDWALSEYAMDRMRKAVDRCGDNRPLMGIVVDAVKGASAPPPVLAPLGAPATSAPH